MFPALQILPSQWIMLSKFLERSLPKITWTILCGTIYLDINAMKFLNIHQVCRQEYRHMPHILSTAFGIQAGRILMSFSTTRMNWHQQEQLNHICLRVIKDLVLAASQACSL